MKIKFLLFFVLFFAGGSVSFADSLQVHTSLFGVYGNYSSGVVSKAGSAFITISYNYRHHFTLGYDYLTLKAEGWDYTQRTTLAGASLMFDPLYIKASYGRINGDFKDFSGYTSEDGTNIYSGEVILRTGAAYLGAGVNFVDLNSYFKRKNYQFVARFDYYYGYLWYLSVKPVVSLLDTRNPYSAVPEKETKTLFSVGAKFNYLLAPGWVAKFSGALGRRNGCYDNDLLSIYNQTEDQLSYFSAGVEWYPSYLTAKTAVSLGWQFNQFDGYDVNYLIAGLKISW